MQYRHTAALRAGLPVITLINTFLTTEKNHSLTELQIHF